MGASGARVAEGLPLPSRPPLPSGGTGRPKGKGNGRAGLSPWPLVAKRIRRSIAPPEALRLRTDGQSLEMAPLAPEAMPEPYPAPTRAPSRMAVAGWRPVGRRPLPEGLPPMAAKKRSVGQLMEVLLP